MGKYISLHDDKYGVVNLNGELICYRYGDRWESKSEGFIGDGFVLALVQKIEDLQEENSKLSTELLDEISKKSDMRRK